MFALSPFTLGGFFLGGDISKVYCIKQFKTRIIRKVSSQNNKMKLYFLTLESCLFFIFQEYRRRLFSTKCSFVCTKVDSSRFYLTALVHLGCSFRKWSTYFVKFSNFRAFWFMNSVRESLAINSFLFKVSTRCCPKWLDINITWSE